MKVRSNRIPPIRHMSMYTSLNTQWGAINTNKRFSHTRVRHKGKDWASYGDALRTLADKAYGDLEEKAQERLVLTQYLSHIDNPQVALGVRQKRLKMVEAAVVDTSELESYLGNISSASST